MFSPMWNQDVLSIYQISSPLSEGKASLSYVSALLFASYFASYELFPLLLIPCLACREDDGEVSFLQWLMHRNMAVGKEKPSVLFPQCSFMNTVTENNRMWAWDGTLELIRQSPYEAAEAQRVSHPVWELLRQQQGSGEAFDSQLHSGLPSDPWAPPCTDLSSACSSFCGYIAIQVVRPDVIPINSDNSSLRQVSGVTLFSCLTF